MMTVEFPFTKIAPLREQLKNHPIYEAVQTKKQLKLFMESHIFSVWDFMSLTKAVQHEIAPSGAPWFIRPQPDLQRFINEIVLEEESDALPDNSGYTSHFQLYCLAMDEVKANSALAKTFSNNVRTKGFQVAIQQNSEIPKGAKRFMQQTMNFIQTGDAHRVAAAFALGREHIIPTMFRSLLAKMNCAKEEAPYFHYYLERHIELDQDHHGPLSMKTLLFLCKNDKRKLREAEESAIVAIEARLAFWDSLLEDLQKLN